MNGAALLGIAIAFFIVGYLIYGKILKRIFGIDNNRACPSESQRDNIDYIPTPLAVLFGHHFASIAGAGPIVGPTLAVYLGWGPAILWILLGCVFIGAMHDFAAMFLSVRNRGGSIGQVIQNELGYLGRQIFLLFCLVTLILVISVFTLQVAQSFIATPAVATASVLFILMAPVFGALTSRKMLSLSEASLVFVPLLFICVLVGMAYPMDFSAHLSRGVILNIWIIGLLYYALVASIIPVWILLQPRDYLNSYLLYAMMLIGVIGIFFAAPGISAPATAAPPEGQPGVFPLLFVTIACGACSGFHSLVASGTSSKQVAKENHILPIAYGSMLVEGILAVIAVIAVCACDSDVFTTRIAGLLSGKIAAPTVFAQGLAQFATVLHIPYHLGVTFISLAISAFMLTSLDTATRLTRFVWQELVMPPAAPSTETGTAVTEAESQAAFEQAHPVRAFFASRWVGTFFIIIPAGWLAISGNGSLIWPVFGSSNQLLAGLTLLAITLWLKRSKRPKLFAFLPMIFMFVISVWALISLLISRFKLLKKCIDAGQTQAGIHQYGALLLVSVILLLLAAWLICLGVKRFFCQKTCEDSGK